MNSWNDSTDLCSWIGVTCNVWNKKVVILNLEAQKLVGFIPSSIGNLTYLTGINLIDNNFHGPTQLIGSIPDQLSSLLNLTHFWVDDNNLTGAIPDWIGKSSSLYAISLAYNNFEGSIPNALGRLTSLGRFVIPSNKLSGTVPSSIYNISSIYYITATQNQLHGELPQNVGTTLPNLEIFAGGKLRFLDFAENGLPGKLPAENLNHLVGPPITTRSREAAVLYHSSLKRVWQRCPTLLLVSWPSVCAPTCPLQLWFSRRTLPYLP
ncbi:LRR receptor-like serine/threonine-protein kinase [Pyrus ussuriensis x Pyrus communis]|uniref:LRR receptor-like serine/threonine-protein kinase n=1 Tax=Pyrus ussuriensis x Pyrus communis TaxID=2448454 RepID=A0A5N5H6Y1_9ROSA|nr:LRR receptor-like serine/threonine-protein kinase [Pyrus ussuriensis x Pyrus communis]